MCMIQANFVRSQEEKINFAQMLADSDVLALAGRALLILTEEGDLFKDLGHEWLTFLSGYLRLGAMFKKSILVAPHLFADSPIIWFKVFEQLSLPIQLGSFNMVDSDPKLFRCMIEMKQAWVSLGEPFRANSPPQPKPCTYSRCFQSLTQEKTFGARYLCGRCGRAAYCDPNCQRAHWTQSIHIG
ncbi:hypothetical protein BDV93DRAFT_338363 [Ceratobasidium sp. AG-I]|nr:hypothetical protein BDV93DRAFT_338363 [Ceratobasidium sp. AG-I]